MLHVTLRVSFIQHTVFFSTVYVHLRHNRLCFSRTLDYTGTLTSFCVNFPIKAQDDMKENSI